MLRSMNSAISGLKNHQVFMDVIGNNIANVNTTGFKASRTTFQTMLSQTIRGAISPAVGRGGVNTVQIGLGSAIAGVDLVNTQGTLTTTTKVTDMAIQGDGFFVVTDGTRKYYTRDGSFDLGADATLISPATGLRVMGWMAREVNGVMTVNNALPPEMAITLPIGQSVTAKKTTNMIFNGNLNGAATDKLASGPVEGTTDGRIGFDIATTDTVTFTYNGQTFTTSGFAAAYTKNTTTLATIAADLEAQMNAAIRANGGFPADIKVSVIDDAGAVGGEAVLAFRGSKALTFGSSAASSIELNNALKNRSMRGLESMTSSMVVYDSLGNAHEVNIRFEKELDFSLRSASVATAAGTTYRLEHDTTAGTMGIGGGGTMTFIYGGTTYTVTVPAATAGTTTLTAFATDLQAAIRAAVTAGAGGAAQANEINVTVIDNPLAAGEAHLLIQGGRAFSITEVTGNAGLNALIGGPGGTDPGHVSTTENTWRWTVVNLDGASIDSSLTTSGAGHGYITFDSDGKFRSVRTLNADGTTARPSTAFLRLDFTNGAQNDQDINLDFSQITQLQDGNTVAAALNDGFATGTLLSFVIGQDGVITGNYSNGVSQTLAQIALAVFPNVGGLNHISQNLFVESANSGIPNIGAPNSGSRGQINAGQLEVSNVDLAVQFTDMIRAQRGFQANSRLITTSDEMLQDLVSLKR